MVLKYENEIKCITTYRLFTRVSELKIWYFFLVIGIEINVCGCTFDKYSVITQFAKRAAGEQLCLLAVQTLQKLMKNHIF
jgi:hypothetical protein